MNIMKTKTFEILSHIGYFGPANLLFLTIVMILSKVRTLFKGITVCTIVIVWTFICSLINMILKSILKHPRPNKQKYVNVADKHHSKQYGMPSGHASIVANLFVFLCLQFNTFTVNTLAFTQLLLTCWQRRHFNMHTTLQLMVGTIIGSVFGYCLYIIIKKKELLSKVDNVKTAPKTEQAYFERVPYEYVPMSTRRGCEEITPQDYKDHS